MSLDIRQLEGFDLDSLQKELQNRKKQVEELEESVKWAIKEHEEQITQLQFAIEWKKRNG